MKLKSRIKIEARVNEWLSYGLTCSGTASYTEDRGFIYDKEGQCAISCLFYFESQGKVLPCKEIELLESYFQAKGSLDLMIKMWAEDRAKGWLGLNEFKQMREEMAMSEWVFNAVENQKVKLYDKVKMCL